MARERCLSVRLLTLGAVSQQNLGAPEPGQEAIGIRLFLKQSRISTRHPKDESNAKELKATKRPCGRGSGLVSSGEFVTTEHITARRHICRGVCTEMFASLAHTRKKSETARVPLNSGQLHKSWNTMSHKMDGGGL